ncbi:MAG: hypothetical protein M0T83_02365 [Nitrospiraceae bacterium]|nr:hypothetical protein [Nitrospiraceae bacterium]
MSESLFCSVRMRIHREGEHLSGAEDLVPLPEVNLVLTTFWQRLFPFVLMEGTLPLQQIVTIDPVFEKNIVRKSLLAVQTMKSGSSEETEKALPGLLRHILPSGRTELILEIFKNEIMGSAPRNGALLATSEGKILPEGFSGGIRTTHVGCVSSLRRSLENQLDSFFEKPNYRFVDALVLASKVLSSGEVLLEICASDDPRYTTGYVASPLFGYVRIPHMKRQGIRRGGRLYVISPDSTLPALLSFLSSTPVLFDSQSSDSDLMSHPDLTIIPSVGGTFPQGETAG